MTKTRILFIEIKKQFILHVIAESEEEEIVGIFSRKKSTNHFYFSVDEQYILIIVCHFH
jgi:hypothetical protein